MILRFLLPWTFIACIVGYDIHLTVKHFMIMDEVELNPVGRALLKDPHGVAMLVSIKAVGLAIALLLVFGLWQFSRFHRAVTISSYCVAILHVALLCVFQEDGDRRAMLALNDQMLRELNVKHRNQKSVLGYTGVKPLTPIVIHESKSPTLEQAPITVAPDKSPRRERGT